MEFIVVIGWSNVFIVVAVFEDDTIVIVCLFSDILVGGGVMFMI